jgi:hypothetical protein
MACATGGILFGQTVIPEALKSFDPGNPDSAYQENAIESYQTVMDAVYAALFMTCLHILLGTTTSAADDIGKSPSTLVRSFLCSSISVIS